MTSEITVPTAPVTLLDIYTRQVEMGAQLAVIHEQLKAIPDHETRLRRLESFYWKFVGAALAASALSSGLITWISLAVAHH